MTIEHAGRKFTLKEKISVRMENTIRRRMREIGIEDTYMLYYSDELTEAIMPVMLEGDHDGVDWLECDADVATEVRDYFFGKLRSKKSELTNT